MHAIGHMQLLLPFLGRGRVTFPLSLAFIPLFLNEVGCLGAKQGCSYPSFGLFRANFYFNSTLG